MESLPVSLPQLFLSTPSARRATGIGYGLGDFVHNFYPRPPRGGRRRNVGLYFVQLLFLSTPSARRATHYKASTDKKANDFYPRPPRGGRQLAAAFYNAGLWISIHALREEGDDKIPYVEHFLDISIHALREEGDRTAQASSMRP